MESCIPTIIFPETYVKLQGCSYNLLKQWKTYVINTVIIRAYMIQISSTSIIVDEILWIISHLYKMVRGIYNQHLPSGCQLNPKGCWIDTLYITTIWHPNWKVQVYSNYIDQHSGVSVQKRPIWKCCNWKILQSLPPTQTWVPEIQPTSKRCWDWTTNTKTNLRWRVRASPNSHDGSMYGICTYIWAVLGANLGLVSLILVLNHPFWSDWFRDLDIFGPLHSSDILFMFCFLPWKKIQHLNQSKLVSWWVFAILATETSVETVEIPQSFPKDASVDSFMRNIHLEKKQTDLQKLLFLPYSCVFLESRALE